MEWKRGEGGERERGEESRRLRKTERVECE